MDLRKRILTQNECYKAGKNIEVKGLMIHSTGANNPKLGRYVDAPELGEISSNHWNQPKPGGREVCVHAFIGKDQDGKVATYQTLPWNHRGWHAGGGANNTHIGVEICEDDLTDRKYFDAVYKEAVELFAYLCKQYGLTEKDIITHCEGYKQGVASNHGDVMHWFPKHGKSMDNFRADVKIQLLGKPVAPKPQPVKSIDDLAREVIDGKHGSGEARKKALGDKYDAVQKRVNEMLGSKQSQPAKPKPKTISQLADEVMRGLHGSGRERMLSLGSQYAAVQAEINKRLRAKK